MKSLSIAALAMVSVALLVGCGEKSEVGDNPAAANSVSASAVAGQRGRVRDANAQANSGKGSPDGKLGAGKGAEPGAG